MTSDLELWRAAAAMIQRYGGAAVSQARRRADDLDGQGDRAGQAAWHAIMRAIEELQRTAPEGAVH